MALTIKEVKPQKSKQSSDNLGKGLLIAGGILAFLKALKGKKEPQRGTSGCGICP